MDSGLRTGQARYQDITASTTLSAVTIDIKERFSGQFLLTTTITTDDLNPKNKCRRTWRKQPPLFFSDSLHEQE
jgi:hypothetical protein